MSEKIKQFRLQVWYQDGRPHESIYFRASRRCAPMVAARILSRVKYETVMFYTVYMI